MIINGKKYVLSKRRMREKYNLFEQIKTLELPAEGQHANIEQIKNGIIVRAKAISDSLYTTYLKLTWWKKPFYFFKYRKFKKYGALFLYKYLDEDELLNAEKELSEIEGQGKKKSPAGNRSGVK